MRLTTHSLHLAVVLLGLSAAGLAACDNEGPAERAGKAVDNAAASTGKAVENTGEAIQDKAKQ